MPTVDLHSIRGKIAPKLLEQMLPVDSPLYCEGQVAYDWENGVELEVCAKGSYEKMLLDFLIEDPGSTEPSNNILIVVGGIGTGKTTSVRRAIEIAVRTERRCSLAASGFCSHTPTVFNLDFAWKSDKVPQDSPNEDEKLEFWKYLAAEVGGKADAQISAEEEVTGFWWWCLEQKRLLSLSFSIHRGLKAASPIIQAAVEGDQTVWSRTDQIRSLFATRETLIQSLGPQDLAWYNAFRVRYTGSRLKGDCRCKYLVVDNVDHLMPEVQRLAVEASFVLSEIIGARTIVVIRPLTYKRSVHGYNIVKIERHRAPHIAEVINKRIDALVSEGRLGELEIAGLREIAGVVAGDFAFDTPMSNLLNSTSGMSVRFALRNFTNMFDSKVLSAIPIGDSDRDLRVSDLTSAFLFGERTHLIPQSFDNLYSVDGDSRADCWLVKPRMLDYLCRRKNKKSSLAELATVMGRFGHGKDVVLGAFNELLTRTRPLIWSDEGLECSRLDSAATLVVTPIGLGYYSRLFGEVFYDQACMPTDALSTGGIRGVYEFHQLLTEQDLKEAIRVREKYSLMFYFGLYGADIPGISVIHARRMLRGLPKRIKQSDVYDPRRAEWIIDRFRAEFGQLPARSGLD